MEYDYVFWFGDLNYRVELSREECNELLTRSNILVSVHWCFQLVFPIAGLNVVVCVVKPHIVKHLFDKTTVTSLL